MEEDEKKILDEPEKIEVPLLKWYELPEDRHEN
jgi:hypothetical protein